MKSISEAEKKRKEKKEGMKNLIGKKMIKYGNLLTSPSTSSCTNAGLVDCPSFPQIF